MKRFTIFVIFLLSLSMVSAEFSQEDAENWLSGNIRWSNSPLEEISFAIMVLESQNGLNQLKSKILTDSKDMDSKDMALAVLALNSMGESIEDELEFLEDSLKGVGTSKEDWNIQVVIDEAGSCNVKYEGKEEGMEFEFDEDGNIVNEENPWINFEDLTDFEFDKALEEINVECEFTTSTPRISIFKKTGNDFYIIEERFASNVNFEIKNGCYSLGPGSSGCNPEYTFYVSWVLNKLGVDLMTENYLKGNIHTALEYAMMSDIDSSYLSDLINKQNEDGSFGSGVYTTSFAIDSLKNSNYLDEKDEAETWVETQQDEETGKIGDRVTDTAVALYLIYDEMVPPGNGGDGEDEGTPNGGSGSRTCDGDSDCDWGTGEICDLVNNICVQPSPEGFCNVNSDCRDLFGEICDPLTNTCITPGDERQPVCGNFECETGERDPSSINYCLRDCEQNDPSGDDRGCNYDGFCDSLTEDEYNCPSDCEIEEERSLWWVWVSIIILVLGGIIFFVLMKMKKGSKGEKPSYLQGPRNIPSSYSPQKYKAPARTRPPRDRALESELDRSIKEAQDLLKKKK